MLILSAAGQLLVDRLIERPGPIARATVGLASISLAAEMFAWSERNPDTELARAFHRPGHEIQRLIATKEPTSEQLEVGVAALSEILRVESEAGLGRPRLPASCSTESTTSGSLWMTSMPPSPSIATPSECRWCIARRSTSRESRRCCSTSAMATSSSCGRSVPRRAVGKFVAKRGAGLHHVAYAVADIEEALRGLRDAGIELIDSEPRRGIRDSLVAFLHPRSTGGVLTELVQPKEAH